MAKRKKSAELTVDPKCMVDPKYGRWEPRGRDIVRNGYDGGGLIGKAGGDFYDDGRKDRYGRTTEPILDTLANAILMAAAPEMLWVLKEALHQMETSSGKHDLGQLFRHAINKAEGGAA
jgi:hypothetical protein